MRLRRRDADASDQDIGGNAISDVFAGSILVASGEAGGPSVDFDDSDEAWAFDAQAGYFSRFRGGPWLWGAKFSYKYLEADVTSGPDNIPRRGTALSRRVRDAVFLAPETDRSGLHRHRDQGRHVRAA